MKKQFVFQTCLTVLLLAGPWLAGPALADSGWNIQTVDSTGNVGYYTSLALDAGGNAHISYYDATNADLKYAAWTGSSWNIETVDSEGSVGTSGSLALNSNGYPRISYHDGWSLKYAAFNGSNWDVQTAVGGSSTGIHSSLALDSSDAPHIAHYRWWPYGNDVLHTYWDGSSWSTQMVDNGYEGASGLSLVLDSNDNPHISYHDYDDHGLRYAVWNGSSWDSQLLDTAARVSGIGDTSLVLDSSGHAHISYSLGPGPRLKYAAWDGSDWHIETVDDATNVNIYTALALDGSGFPHIVYYDDTNQDLKYAAWDGLGWAIETVDSTGDVGLYMSIALDADDNAHISYYDATNGDLKYAFIPEPADPIADAGADQAVHPGGVVTLDGSGSSDPEGNYPLTYFWQITSMPEASTAELWDSDTVNPTFIPDLMGDYIIELVVTDSLGLESTPDSVLVSTYNTPPVADAGPDQAIIELYTTVQLDGTQSWDDEGDPITYMWTIITKPAGSAATLDDLTSATPTFIADVQGNYVISLIVTDIFAAESEPDTVTMSFENVQPVADAGDGQAVIVGETVPLDGSGSYDNNLDELTYSWSFVSKPEGSVAVLSGPTSVQTSFVADWPGTYVVSLVINDGFVDSEPDNVTIEVISTQDAVVETIFELIDQVNLLPAESLKNKNMKKPLINKINVVLNKIDRGLYEEALDKLQNDILQKTNGCADIGQPDRNDWITTCEEQSLVYPLIIEAIELLENLI